MKRNVPLMTGSGGCSVYVLLCAITMSACYRKKLGQHELFSVNNIEYYGSLHKSH